MNSTNYQIDNLMSVKNLQNYTGKYKVINSKNTKKIKVCISFVFEMIRYLIGWMRNKHRKLDKVVAGRTNILF